MQRVKHLKYLLWKAAGVNSVQRDRYMNLPVPAVSVPPERTVRGRVTSAQHVKEAK